jgi:di/tricarboxylate transporter
MFVFLITEVIQPHLTLFATCVLLNLIGIITMEHIQHGYSAEALLTVIILMVCVEPLQKTNLLSFLARYMFGGGTWVRFNMLRMMIFMVLLSTFLANAPMTALFTPIILEWCRMTDQSQSKFLMPMLFSILMGGMNSLIGSSTNILVEGLLRTYGIPSLGFLEVSLVAIPCLIISFIYMLTIGWFLLPTNESVSVSILTS